MHTEMPKNAKSKKNSAKRADVVKRELLLRDSVEGTVYGQVMKALGDCNFTVKCSDDITRLCHLRKKCKRSIVVVDAVVLVGTRDFQQDKGDIVFVYTHEEAGKLRSMGEVNFSVNNHYTLGDEDDDEEDEKDVMFDFDDI
jgi:translation initiation factor 1A